MLILEKVIMIATVNLLLAISPGPSFVILCKTTLKENKRAGQVMAMGIGTATAIYVALSAWGVLQIVKKHPAWMIIFSCLSGLFLITLGFYNLLHQNKETSLNIKNNSSTCKQKARIHYWEGLTIGLLNPTLILGVLSIFTLIIKPINIKSGLLYGCILVIIDLMWLVSLVAILSYATIRKWLLSHQGLVQKIAAVLLIFMGAYYIINVLFTGVF